jgi:stearoyl-CoA desaturase (Delta-9 desaturase)
MILQVLVAVLVGVAIGFAVTTLANICTTVYLHRALSHRGLTLRPPVKFTFRLLTWITTGIRPRQWVAVHRKHHAFTDIEGDPHSPLLLGWVRVQFTNVALYRREARNDQTMARYAKDLPADRWDRVLFDHALIGLGIGVALLVWAFGPIVGVVAAIAHVNLYLSGSAAINAICHHFGKRPYQNGAGNLQWLAWLTAGEGLHNNHHAAPTSARLSHRHGEFDPGWWVISVMRAAGLAKVRLNELRFARPPSARRAA